MEKWKRAFDRHTQIASQLPLPTAFFINHFADMNNSSNFDRPVIVKPDLESLCDDLQKRTGSQSLCHLNAMSNQGIFEAFEDFALKILADIEMNRPKNDPNAFDLDLLVDEDVKKKSGRVPS